MKIYMLDVTGCKKEQLGGYDKPIPCKLGVRGMWGADLDVMEERIESSTVKGWRAERRKIIDKANRRAGTRVKVLEQAPIGVNLADLPIGAIITVIEEK